jgi:3-oxoacyl-[acyl-carrier-protein] synthase-3
MKAKIKAISQFFPKKVLTNDELSVEFPEWNSERIESKLGIAQRYITDNSETTSTLAIGASQLLFKEHNIDKNSIDFILLCTQSPDYLLPTTACIVQDSLGIPTTAGALDFNLGCSGYVYGLSLAKGLILGRIAKNILLITSETYSKYIDHLDKGNRTIFGDGATATLISTEGFAEILDFELGTDGRGAQNLIVKGGGSKHPNTPSEGCFYMNGPEIFNFTVNNIPPLINSTLLKNGLNLKDIDLTIFHQANTFILNYLRKQLDIPKDKFYIHLKDYGNTVSSTIPLALKHAFDNKKLKGNILLAGFGVGYSWGGCILHCK